MGDLHRLIAFDLDGTLVDSRRDLAESANQLILELGGAVLPEDAIARMVGEGAAVLVERALAASGLDAGAAPNALRRFLEIYGERLLLHTRLYEGVEDAVRFAQSCGRLMVLTNKPTALSERILASLGVHDCFEEVVGGDGPWPRKPDPTALTAAMARFEAFPASTLLVGDSAIDYETAEAASVRFCMAAYGFSRHTLGPQHPVAPAWTAASPSDLKPIIHRFTAGC